MDVGDGGWTMTAGGGEGGYEWIVEVLASSWMVKFLSSLVGMGMFVREWKDRAASAWWGDAWGTGVRGMKTPGGNDGDRIRMYQPRFGRWIVQHIVLVGLYCAHRKC